jgi:hypothetical protein
MSCKSLLGVQTIKAGTCGADGAMGTTLTSIGLIVPDSVILTFEEQVKTDIYIENQVDPYLTVMDANRLRSLKCSSRDLDPATLAKFFSGTATTDVWTAGRAAETAVEQSIEIVTKVAGGNSWKIEIPRANVSASLDGSLTAKDTAKMNFNITVLSPQDTAETMWPVRFTRS